MSPSFPVSPAEPFPPAKIWILGAGHFGHTAAQRLSQRYPDAEFLVVDLQTDRLRAIQETFGIPTVARESIEFLTQRPIPRDVWIVPAVPVHVAFQWLLAKIADRASVQPLPVQSEVDRQVPNPYRMAAGGTLYASFATFVCPDVCNEPAEICTYTREPRPGNLFDRLGDITLPGLKVVVVRSWQLAPGVGGYPESILAAALHSIMQQPGDYLVATSCRCHAVIDRLRWQIS